MHPTRYSRRPRTWGLVLLAGLSAAAANGQPPPPAQPPVSGPAQVDKTGALIVPLGGLVSYDPKLEKGDVLQDVAVSQENVLAVRVDPANPNRLLLSGRTAGLTQLTLTLKDRPKVTLDVVVQPDLSLLRNLIRRTVPTAAVDVQPGVGNVVILSGYVTSPQDATVVAQLAGSAVGGGNNVINAVQIGGGQQVQIDVVVASVSRTELRQRGFDFSIPVGPRSTDTFQSIISGLIQSPLGALPPAISGAANIQFGRLPAPFFGALQALRAEGLAKFLSEPKVTTQSGRPAFFRAGGQQAIISGTAGITGPGVQLVPFGTELEVVPIVYGNGMIWLEINPRISAVNQGLGIVIGGANSPGFTEQQVRTAVMLESGQTYAIGGLIETSVSANSSKVPVLGDLPYVGTAFSRVSHQAVETELIILVTPRLVGPLNCDQAPRRLPGQETRTPDDYELFLENILEAPRGQRKVCNGRCYNAPWKCDPTAALFPCAGGVCTGHGPGGACNGPAAGGAVRPGPVVGGAPHPVHPAMKAPTTLPVVPPAPPAPEKPAAPPPADPAPTAGPGGPIAPVVPLPGGLPPAVVIPEAPRN
jgi:pilus assembly protein CpaC